MNRKEFMKATPQTRCKKKTSARKDLSPAGKKEAYRERKKRVLGIAGEGLLSEAQHGGEFSIGTSVISPQGLVSARQNMEG